MHSFWSKQNWSIFKKSFSTSEYIWKSHYEALGIHPNATQNDVKTAYYKLSKIYHPDKNKDSANAAEKFRDITAAYEVLGNLKTRKMYDKGILNMPESSITDMNVEKTDTFEHERFYQSRNKPNPRMASSNKARMYNLDEWTRQHYETTFARRYEAKASYDSKVRFKSLVQEDKEKMIICWTALFITVFTYLLFQYTVSRNEDVTSKKNKKVKA